MAGSSNKSLCSVAVVVELEHGRREVLVLLGLLAELAGLLGALLLGALAHLLDVLLEAVGV